jgi:hypothetical protein
MSTWYAFSHPSRPVFRQLTHRGDTGVIKTHRLTYESCVPAYAKANRLDCTSTWTAPSRVLKDWTDHFHLRTGSGPNSSGTLEISFYCEENNCRVTSYGNEPSKGESRSLHKMNMFMKHF